MSSDVTDLSASLVKHDGCKYYLCKFVRTKTGHNHEGPLWSYPRSWYEQSSSDPCADQATMVEEEDEAKQQMQVINRFGMVSTNAINADVGVVVPAYPLRRTTFSWLRLY